MFIASSLVAALNSGLSVFYLMRVGALVPSVSLQVITGVQGSFSLFESPATSSPGLPLPLLNQNRTAIEVSTVQVYSAPTVVTNGLLLLQQFVFGGDTSAASGGAGQSADWILKPNTDYLIRVTNQTPGQNNEKFGVVIKVEGA